ncbi:MAG: selenocysteine-specific translation elongation factor [Gammaproteobacteria bacterium]|nr:selenocysteine-specific translation elongation factor [Gammaproteobacteria bacterium]
MNNTPVQKFKSAPRQLIIATAGHVDHGKTALVRQLTGVETDTLQAEKDRGLTINLGYAYHHFQSEKTGETRPFSLGFVDVPGHTDFIHNMLAGVGSVDFALLVVAADDGIMPQTREHLAILGLLGVSELAIAISKIDRVDATRVTAVEQELEMFLQSFQFERVHFFTVSNINGDGIAELQRHLEMRALNLSNRTTDAGKSGTRFLIDRSFSVKGIGTVVTGSLRAGKLAEGDQLVLAQHEETARIKGIRLDKDPIPMLDSGQRAALNITLSHDLVQRGSWLIEADMLHPIIRFDCRITPLKQDASFRPGAQYHLYHGCSHYLVSIRSLDPVAGYFQIRSHEPLQVCYGDRFIIRDPAATETLAGGYVIDTYVPRRGRSSEARLLELAAKDNKPPAALAKLLHEAKLGVDLQQFSRNYNIPLNNVQVLLESSASETIVFPANSLLGHRALGLSQFESLQNAILKLISEYHQSHPSETGISEPQLSRQLEIPNIHMILSLVIEHLRSSGKISREGTLLQLPDHKAVLSKEETEFMEKIHPLLLSAGNVPPRTRELVEMTGIPLKALERILREVTKSGSLVQIAQNRHFLPATVAELASFTEALAASKEDGAFSVIEFRDASGIGRNLCIEILEYFDGRGFTRRDGNARLLRTDKDNIFG